ncbi:hypothetical protein QTH49_13430 [Clostridium perfringens]|nr:hypothetical protein [Clostridium perfringens]MDM0528457.1 hypothetical protein [Clostridium perfringens]
MRKSKGYFYDEHITLCNDCRRLEDVYDIDYGVGFKCKYNKDGRMNITSGRYDCEAPWFKCKYFKRNTKYITHRFKCKSYQISRWVNGEQVVSKTKYVRGKFKTEKIER